VEPLTAPADWPGHAERFPTPPPTGVLPPDAPTAGDAGALRLTDPVERLADLLAELDE
jgi:hypothetical protein